jgi:hypothetical protein
MELPDLKALCSFRALVATQWARLLHHFIWMSPRLMQTAPVFARLFDMTDPVDLPVVKKTWGPGSRTFAAWSRD